MMATDDQTPRIGSWLASLTAVLTFLAFLPALDADFVNWDDEASFLANTAYRGLGIAELRWAFTTTLLGHWSPLAWITWSLNYVTGALDPWGYHLGNLLLHSANVAVLWLLARRLLATGSGASVTSRVVSAGATVAALVWGLHPLRAEVVAWASARRDVLCGLFYLLAVLAYLRGVDRGAAIERRWWALSVAAFAAALLSKSIAMTLPLSLLVLDVYPLRRLGLGWQALAREKLPYVILAVPVGAVALLARQESGSITGFSQYGAGARSALAAYTFGFSAWSFVWPAGLSPMYEPPQRVGVGVGEARFLWALMAVVALTVLLLLARRRWPAGLSAWAQSLIVLAPVSGVMHSGSQLTADRYTYLASLGFSILTGAALVWALRPAAGRPSRAWLGPLACASGALALVALGAGARSQTAFWRNSETLWRRAVEIDPSCSICESNLGRVVARPGRFPEAETHIRRAIALRPDRPGPYENLGTVALAQGRYREAETHFRRAASLDPGRAASRNALGVALADQARYQEAETEFREAARLSPRLVDAPANLGVLYARQGRFEEAIVSIRRALAIDARRPGLRSDLDRALTGRAVQLAREGRADEAARLRQELSPLASDAAATLPDRSRKPVRGRAPEAAR